jgi:hypothetical protein
MNAGLAVWQDHAYVGNRTDGSRRHPHPGVVVLDIEDPSNPEIVGEIGRPGAGNPGESTRELRVWPGRRLLLVLSFGCDPVIHDCATEAVASTVRFYDIAGPYALQPRLVSTYEPSRAPHEFFLWQDPSDARRALLFMSTPGEVDTSLLVTDISGARRGRFVEVSSWRADFPDTPFDDDLHSLSISDDGSRAYLAHLRNGFLVLDTSDVLHGPQGSEIRLITALEARPRWPGWGAHSAVPIPGRPLVLVTDEVYGSSEPGGGCPWGWARIVEVADPARPVVRSEIRVLPFNDPARCDQTSPERDRGASFSSHNPTVTEHLAFISWHSAGLQVFSTANPELPAMVAAFLPRPLPSVLTEDPALSSGPDRVVMWSYPVIVDGLIWVVDVRNGLYALSYSGPYEDEVGSISFLEGNSNIGRMDVR